MAVKDRPLGIAKVRCVVPIGYFRKGRTYWVLEVTPIEATLRFNKKPNSMINEQFLSHFEGADVLVERARRKAFRLASKPKKEQRQESVLENIMRRKVPTAPQSIEQMTVDNLVHAVDALSKRIEALEVQKKVKDLAVPMIASGEPVYGPSLYVFTWDYSYSDTGTITVIAATAEKARKAVRDELFSTADHNLSDAKAAYDAIKGLPSCVQPLKVPHIVSM